MQRLRFVLFGSLYFGIVADFECYDGYSYPPSGFRTEGACWWQEPCQARDYSTRRCCRNPCPANHYCPGDGGTVLCKGCPGGQYKSGGCDGCTQDTQCATCQINYYCPGDTGLYSCPPYHQCPREGMVWPEPCPACVNNTYSMGACSCSPCSTCPLGKVVIANCTSTSNIQCGDCPSHMYMPSDRVGSSLSECLCKPGTYGSYAAGCRACSVCVNSFKMYSCTPTRDTQCAQCPTNSTLMVAQGTSYMDCACKPGFSGRVTSPNTTTCTPCPKNMYCPGINAVKKCACST